MPAPASLPASWADQDPTNLQYRETSNRRLAGNLDVEKLPVVWAWAKNVAILGPPRKSPFETCDPHSKVRPRWGVTISARVVPHLARMDRPGASVRHWEERAPSVASWPHRSLGPGAILQTSQYGEARDRRTPERGG